MVRVLKTAVTVLAAAAVMVGAAIMLERPAHGQDLVLAFAPGTTDMAPESVQALDALLNRMQGQALDAKIIGHAAAGEAAAPPAGLAAARALAVVRSMDAFAGAQNVAFRADMSGEIVPLDSPHVARVHLTFAPTLTASR